MSSGQTDSTSGGVEDNLQDLTSPDEINRAEAMGFAKAELWLLERPLDEPISVGALLNLHRLALGALYPWAGRWRRTTPRVGALALPSPAAVPSLMAQFADELRHRADACTPNELPALLAWAHFRFVWIHPFENGNGRMARLLTQWLAQQWGLVFVLPQMRNASTQRTAYLQALRAADAGNMAPLITWINAGLVPARDLPEG